MSQENWDRAEALMTDIKEYNPTYARELTNQHGKKGAIRHLKEILDNNDKTKLQLQKTLLEQIPKTNDPYQYRVQELRAQELAQEMAYEEIRALCNPPIEPSEEVVEFLQILRR